MSSFYDIKNFNLLMSVVFEHFQEKFNYNIGEKEEHIMKFFIKKFGNEVRRSDFNTEKEYMITLNRLCISNTIRTISAKLHSVKKQPPKQAHMRTVNDVDTDFKKLEDSRSVDPTKRPVPQFSSVADNVNKDLDTDFETLMRNRSQFEHTAKQQMEASELGPPETIKEEKVDPQELERKFSELFQDEEPQQITEIGQIPVQPVDKTNIFGDQLAAPKTLGQELLMKKPDAYDKLTEDIYNDPKFIMTEYLVVDSRDRNTDDHAEPNQYVLDLGRDYKDLISVELISANVPKTQYLINSANNLIYFDDGTGTITATIPDGNYTIGELTTEIKTQMDAISASVGGSKTYTVTSDSKTNKITIAVNTGTFDMLFDGGSETHGTSTRTKYLDSSIGPIIGFSRSDLTSAATYTGTNQYDINGPTYLILYIKEFEQLNGVHNNSVEDSFAKIILDTDQSSYKYFKSATDYVAKKHFRPLLGKMTKLNVKFLNYDGSVYDFGGLNHTLYFKIISLNQNQSYFN